MKQKLIFLASFFAAAFVFSDEYYVDASCTDDTGSATNWATAKQTIQAAVDLTTDGDTVWVTNGTYNVGGAKTPEHSLMNRVCITNAITVQSVNGKFVTFIEGAESASGGHHIDSVRGVFMANSCLLVGFTITGGHAHGNGNNDFDVSGGGVFLTVGGSVSNCRIMKNSAMKGGGVFLFQGGRVDRCLFFNNKARLRGGGANLHEGGQLVECTLIGNSAALIGGGIFCREGGVAERCVFNNNRSDGYGGGVGLYKGGRLNNSLLDGNTATRRGGGVYMREDGVIKNCTVVRNIANSVTSRGGGICLKNGGEVYNCIVLGNHASKDIDIYPEDGGGKVRYVCSSEEGVGSSCTTENPLFVDEKNGDFQLKAGSPCINEGRNAYAPAGFDLNGNLRIVDETVDLGAYEFVGGQ